MILGIISDAHHYYDEKGRLCTLSLLARQFEMWAGLFDKVIICAPLLPGAPRELHSPYTVGNIELMPIKNAGGNNFKAKMTLILRSVTWYKEIRKLFQFVDAVHIRCPNNVAIPGLIALQKTRLFRQAVYTGSWLGHPGEPLTYRLQKYYLRHCFKGPIAVYGSWPDQPDHIVSSFSPSYSQYDWEVETPQVESRLKKLGRGLGENYPLSLMSVGALNVNKNQKVIIDALSILSQKKINFSMNFFGDGPELANLEERVRDYKLDKHVKFYGVVSQEQLRQFYRLSDFVIQAPLSEGFGKVPIEAFFHGVIPILSDVDMSKQIIGDGLRGRCFNMDNPHEIADNIIILSEQPHVMVSMIRNGRDYALKMTLESWQRHIKKILCSYWKVDLGK